MTKTSDIWADCKGEAQIRRLGGSAWRVVEAQHLIATRKLVGSDSDQQILEQLIESIKPPLTLFDERRSLHFLLTTPFRYPPLKHGSRFGTRAEGGLWYGSLRPRTAFAEVAYYRLLFLEGTRAALTPLTLELSLFRVGVRTQRGVDLTQPPFLEHSDRISSPTNYHDSQVLGHKLRAAGVEAVRYISAREPPGVNVVIISPKAFAESQPRDFETWQCIVTATHVELSRKSFLARAFLRFDRKQFEVFGVLPCPAVE